MFILKKGHQPGVYVPLRALFLVKYPLTGSSLYKSAIFPCSRHCNSLARRVGILAMSPLHCFIIVF